VAIASKVALMWMELTHTHTHKNKLHSQSSVLLWVQEQRGLWLLPLGWHLCGQGNRWWGGGGQTQRVTHISTKISPGRTLTGDQLSVCLSAELAAYASLVFQGIVGSSARKEAPDFKLS
jgi:hypothetical protein